MKSHSLKEEKEILDVTWIFLILYLQSLLYYILNTYLCKNTQCVSYSGSNTS